MHLLVGDIGGTKTELALFDEEMLIASQRYHSGEYASLDAVVSRFMAEHRPSHGQLAAAVFGIAGPIVKQRCHTTNLAWQVDGSALSHQLGCPVQLINDFEAVARGVLELAPRQLHVLQEGSSDPAGPLAVIGAGTGLGQALAIPTAAGPRVLATEGGHCDFAPRGDLEVELLNWLRRRHGRVSVERVVSGPGLITLYEYLVNAGHATAQAALEPEDRAAAISALGLADADPACAKALAMFVEAYGAEAGNLALKTVPSGGLFIAGGIAPKIMPALTNGAFMAAFLDKGRMRTLLESIPVAIVTEPRVSLLGGRQLAVELAHQRQPSRVDTQSMFDVMGGEPVLRAMIDDFVDRMFGDMMIGFFFRNADRARIKAMEYELAAEALDGPVRYSGRPLRQAHAAHRIMGGQFARRTQLLRDTMAEHGLPPGVQAALLAHTESLRDQVTAEPDGTCRD